MSFTTSPMTASSSTVGTPNTPLDKLLLRCSRQFHNSSNNSHNDNHRHTVNRPPDAASVGLGRALAHHLVAATEGQLLPTLLRGSLPESVAHVMLAIVASRLWQQYHHPSAAAHTASTTNVSLSDYAWLGKWLLQLEEAVVLSSNSRGSSAASAATTTLDACIRAFGVYSYLLQQQQSQLQNQSTADLPVFYQLQWTTTKMAVWRTVLQLAVEDATLLAAATATANDNPSSMSSTRIICVGSPYLCLCVFGKAHDSQQQLLAIQTLLRYLWMAWTSSSPCLSVVPDCAVLLTWMTKALRLFMQCYCHAEFTTFGSSRHDPQQSQQHPHATTTAPRHAASRESRNMALDVAEHWLSELAFLAQAAVARYMQELDDEQDMLEQQQHGQSSTRNPLLLYQLLEPWFQTILHDVLPKLLQASNNGNAVLAADTHLLLPAIQGAIQALLESSGNMQQYLPLKTATTLALATTILTTMSTATRTGLMELLLLCLPATRTGRTILDTMILIVAGQDDGTNGSEFGEMVVALRKHLLDAPATLAAEPSSSQLQQQQQQQQHCVPLVELLVQDSNATMDQIMETADFGNVRLSSTQQVAVMLLGMTVMMDDRDGRVAKGLQFLTSLLQQYAHLGISLLPVIIDRVNVTAQKGSAKTLDLYLEFLCGPMVGDPFCAQEIWNLVGIKLMEESVPTTLKIVLIRKFPKLCASNKRLYRRIIESLGVSITSKQIEIRLAVAATLADLAKDDLIRDVSDVIGWIQTLLTEKEETGMHSLLVHYAILCLHYLVVAQELDFDVVMKVLNKRLCNIFNHEAVIQLSSLVQESLVLLLGDGECESGDSSQDGDELGVHATKTVSPQVTGAISTLLHIGQELSQKTTLNAAQERVRINVYRALCGYSPEALEMDVEAVKSSVASAQALEGAQLSKTISRYMIVRDLALAGIKRPMPKSIKHDDSLPIQFARKMLRLEEDAVGYGIWQKKGRRQEVDAIADMARSVKPGIPSGLPLSAEIREIAIERTSPGASIALLLVSDGSQLSALRDHGDLAFESTDPLLMVFALQGYLHFAASVLSNASGIGEILTEVGSWYEVFVSPDTMYLAFATLSIYIPHMLREDDSTKPYVEELFIVVLDAYKNQRFQKEDIAKICISVVAVSTLRYGALDRVEEVIKLLEQTVRGYGGEQTFGAFYGLALIGQALQKFCSSAVLLPVVDEVKGLYFRISAFLVEELIDCYEECDESLTRFVNCLRSGDATSDLVVSMSDLDSNSITLLMTKSIVARYLFISCAVCLPGLAFVNAALHLAALRMLEAFDWGGGKGFALPPMLKACDEAALFTSEELNHIYSSFGLSFESKITEERSDLDSEGLDDIFFALNGTTAKSTSHGLRRTLVGNRDLFDEDGCVTSLISVFCQIAPLPCLGASYFTAPVEIERNVLASSDHESIVEIIRQAANETQSRYSDMAIILMGLLSSLRYQQRLEAIAESLPKEAPKKPVSLSNDATSLLDFDSMPRPQSGTILAGLLDEIELQSNSKSFAALLRHSDPKKVTFTVEDESLTTAITVLEAITLPKQLVVCFLEPLLQLHKVAITERCISLLCTQLKGRRRAAFDAKEYSALAFKLANLSLDDWKRYACEGESLKLFLSSLPYIAPKFPSDGSPVFENMWRNSFANRQQDMELVRIFLASAKDLLSGTSLSPKLTNALRRLVVGTISEDVLDLPLATLRLKADETKPSLIELYASCLAVLPRASLEETEFFNVSKSFDGFGSEAKKVISMLTLMDQNYFTRMSEELSMVGSWLVRKFNAPVTDADRESLHLIVASFANLSMQESTPVKCSRLVKMLEALLTFKASGARLGIQWLAAIMTYWNRNEPFEDSNLSLGFLYVTASGIPNMADTPLLDCFLNQAVADLAGNLAAFANREKMLLNVANHIHRLYMAWSDLDVDADILECLFQSDIACHQGGHGGSSNDDVFVSLATSTLLSVHGGKLYM